MYLLAEFQFGSRFAFRLGANGENVFRFSKYPGAAFSIPDMLRLKVTNQTNGGLPAW
jgi:hypothetical protein